jgi:plastocyanin
MFDSKGFITGALMALLFLAVGCDYNSPAAPTPPATSTAGQSGAMISLTSSGLTPATVAITPGQAVTFRNDDSIAHEIVSGPVPSYSDCPAINSLGRLEPGQSKQTAALTESRSCGFLDLLRTGDRRWQGTITVQ